MTNWKTFKIIGKEINSSSYCDCAELKLDGNVFYKGGREFKQIILGSHYNYPLNDNYQVGDYLEINMDKTINLGVYSVVNIDLPETKDVIRKVSFSVVPSSSNQQLTSNQIQERDERMRRWVEESGGEYEVDFIARQEQREDGSISARELKWTYRKKY